ncbi:hypothetical protein V3I05_03200 [Helicobacter mastomyrinus]|uniref:Uncharacterized protein n=1 Tax=Helicobacter mastomyrinus TaxID=287948 RepID=A0ABZ3F926_9HELI
MNIKNLFKKPLKGLKTPHINFRAKLSKLCAKCDKFFTSKIRT